MYLKFQFCTHQRICILHFLKKVKFVLPYCTVHIACVLPGPFSPGDGGEGVTRGAAGQLRSGCANREGFVVQLLHPRPENTEGRLHCKKKVSGFLVPARERLVSDIPAGDGKTANLFLQCGASGF
jgi:hypothetical protein